jgi:hypothetical protein
MINTETHHKYAEFVINKLNPDIRNSECHYKMGYLILKLISECGEVVGELCKRERHNKPIGKETFIDELGDCLYYLYGLVHSLELAESVQEQLFTTLSSEQYSQPIPPWDELSAILLENAARIATDWRYKRDFLMQQDLLVFAQSFKMMMQYFNTNLYEVMTFNHQKLTKRHGQAYSSSFYTHRSSV